MENIKVIKRWKFSRNVCDSIQDDAILLESIEFIFWWTKLKSHVFFFMDDGNERKRDSKSYRQNLPWFFLLSNLLWILLVDTFVDILKT
jgi:hypothetical protein